MQQLLGLGTCNCTLLVAEALSRDARLAHHQTAAFGIRVCMPLIDHTDAGARYELVVSLLAHHHVPGPSGLEDQDFRLFVIDLDRKLEFYIVKICDAE